MLIAMEHGCAEGLARILLGDSVHPLTDASILELVEQLIEMFLEDITKLAERP